ncbi:MAG TPA: glycosyltransferase family 87 protein [Anaerolineaceae bacterium]|nr:glycosyltransferase family 87 protein [Anaerolineaceae bacterium]
MRRRRNIALTLGLGFVLGVGLLVLLTWGNLSYVRQNPGGNDFLVHWMGTRSFLVDGISPYSDQTALRIQTFAYGRPAQKGEHQLRVAYPFYSIIVFFPFALFSDFSTARALWMTVLEVALLGLAFLSIRLANWKPSFLMLVFYTLFSILWYHSVRPLINGNAVILVALAIVGALLAIRSGADELAGVLLAFTTIKPQVVLIFLIFVVLWAIINRRWRLIAWLFGTMVILVAIATFLMPDWILQNIHEVLIYPSYNPPGTPGAALATLFPAMGQRLGYALTGVIIVILLFEWISGRNADFRGFVWMACLTLVASQWSGIQTDPGNFLVCFPAFALIFALIDERYRKMGWLISTLIMLFVGIGLWALFIKTVDYSSGQPLQSPIMFFPLPAILFILLFWVRWWAFHPVSNWFDLVYERENPKIR